MSFERLHTGPRPSTSSRAALVSTPSGVVLVQRGGWRDADVVTWRLSDAGWEGPTATGLKATYDGPLAWFDGRLRVAMRQDDGLEMWTEGEGVTRIAIDAPEGRGAAAWDGRRVVLVLDTTLWVYEDGQVRPLGDVASGTDVVAGGGRTVCIGETSFELRGDERVALPDIASLSTPTFDEGRGTFVTLVDEDPTVPCALEGGAWKACAPPLEDDFELALLAWDPRRRTPVLFGGSDNEHSMQGARNATLRIDDGRRIAAPWERRHGRRNSFHDVGERSVLLSHSHRSALAVGARGFEPWIDALAGDARHDFDDQCLRAAGSAQGLWMLDDKGRVWLGSAGQWRRQSKRHEALAQRRDGRLAWDAREGCLLLVGGDDRNDTWVWRPGKSWKQAPTGGLAAGNAALAATPSGVYALVGQRLFLREGEHWTECLKYEGNKDAKYEEHRSLLYDPRRNLLLSVSGGFPSGTHLRAWRPDGVQDVERFPKDLHRDVCDGAAVGLDPLGDRLLIAHFNELHAWPLSQLGGAHVGLPGPAAGARSPARAPVPAGAYRNAARLVPTGTQADVSALSLPAEHTLMLWLPASERLPLGARRGVAVAMHPDLWTHDSSDPFSPAFAVVFTDVAPPGPIVGHRGEALLAREEPFEDPDPSLRAELDAGPGWELARQTKLGGFANLLQGGAEEQAGADTLASRAGRRTPDFGRCRTCAREVLYRVQLSSDLYEIGDCGRAWLYVCPDGCDAGVVAESL